MFAKILLEKLKQFLRQFENNSYAGQLSANSYFQKLFNFDGRKFRRQVSTISTGILSNRFPQLAQELFLPDVGGRCTLSIYITIIFIFVEFGVFEFPSKIPAWWFHFRPIRPKFNWTKLFFESQKHKFHANTGPKRVHSHQKLE